MFPYKYICVEGNIGAGKTSFCQKVKAEFNCKMILEQFADNPFLPLFYREPERYAFTVELFFMTERYKQLQSELTQQDLFSDFVIADYSFIKTLLFARQNLIEEEFRLFQKMFNVLHQTFPNPDIYVYFHRNTDELHTNINKRGRSYEMDITDSYLTKIQNSYFEYFRNVLTFPILVIDLRDLDIINNEDNFKEILNLINRSYQPGVHRISLG